MASNCIRGWEINGQDELPVYFYGRRKRMAKSSENATEQPVINP